MDSLAFAMLCAGSLLTDPVAEARDHEHLRLIAAAKDIPCSEVVKQALNKIEHNPQIQDIVNKQLIASARKRVDATGGLPSIRINQRLSPDDVASLSECFHMFNLNFDKATDVGSHADSRAFTTCSYHYLISLMDVDTKNRRSTPGAGYDVVIKDVGGSPMRHFSHRHLSTHSCCPVLSTTDALRQAMLTRSLDAAHPADPSSEKYLSLLKAKDPRVICNSRAQYCRVRAPNLMFLNSTYDVTLSDLGKMMDQAGALTAHGCLHFSPVVLYRDRGLLAFPRMQFEKFKRDGDTYIRFFFENDPQDAYVHRFSTYTALIRAFTVPSAVCGGYLVRLVRQAKDVLFFSLYKASSSFVPRSSPSRVLTLPMEDVVVVETWDWQTCTRALLDLPDAHMLRRRVVAPRRLFQELYAYALTMSDGKFTARNLTTAAVSYNTREIISGRSIGVPNKPMETDELAVLAHAVYMIAYIRNYERSQALQAQKTDEDAARRSFASRLFSSRTLMKVLSGVLGDSREFANAKVRADDDISSYGESVDTAVSDKKLLDVLFDRKYQTRYGDPVKFVTIEGEVDMFVNAEIAGVGAVEHHTTECVRALNASVTEPILPMEPSALVEMSPAVADCEDDLEVQTVPPDGDCFYHALARSGVSNDSPPVMRRRLERLLQNSNQAPRHLLESVVRNDGTPASFGSNDLLPFVSKEYGCRVCLHHADEMCELYGQDGPIFHIRHDGVAHFDALILRSATTFVAVRVEDYGGAIVDVPSFDAIASPIDDLYSLATAQKRSNRFMKSVANAIYPFQSLGNGGYVSRSGLKLADIAENLSLTFPSLVVDLCAGPGGFTDFLLRKGVKNVIVHCHRKTPLDVRLVAQEHQRISLIYGRLADGDLIDPGSRDHLTASIVRMMKRSLPQLILADGCVEGSGLESVDEMERNVGLIRAEISLALRVLAIGGSFLFKAFNPKSPYFSRIYIELAKKFRNLTLIRSRFTRPFSQEVYVFCDDFVGQREFLIVPDPAIVAKGADVTVRQLISFVDSYIAVHEKATARAEYLLDIAGNEPDGSSVFPAMPASSTELLAAKNSLTVEPRPVVGGGLVAALLPTILSRREVADGLEKLRRFVTDLPPEYRTRATPTGEFAGTAAASTVSRQANAEDIVMRQKVLAKKVQLTSSVAAALVPMISSVRQLPVAINPRHIVDARVIEKLKLHETTIDPSFRIVEIPRGTTPLADELFIQPNVSASVVTVDDSEFMTAESGSVVSFDTVSEISATVALPANDGFDPASYQMPQNAFDAVGEFMRYTRGVLEVAVAEHSVMWRRVDAMLRAGNENGVAQIVNVKRSPWVVRRPDQRIIASADFSDKHRVVFDGVDFVELKKNARFRAHTVANDFCAYCLEPAMLQVLDRIERVDVDRVICDVDFVQAAPGCGKTTRIVDEVASLTVAERSSVIIACCTRAGRDDLAARLGRKIKNEAVADRMVHTYTSLLINDKVHPDSISMCYFDEALMVHPGHLIALIVKYRFQTVMVLGDNMQIPFVNRLEKFDMRFSKLAALFRVTETMNVSWRCPPDVVARLAPMYAASGLECDLKSGSRVPSDTPSVAIKQIRTVDDIPKLPNAKYLTFTQGDKTILRLSGFQTESLSVETVHEFQGGQARDVVVVRLDAVETSRIFLEQTYAIVALSRHTHTLTYYTVFANDALSTMIKKFPTQAEILRARITFGGGVSTNAPVAEGSFFNYSRDPLSYSPFSRIADFSDAFLLKVVHRNSVVPVGLRTSRSLFRFQRRCCEVDSAFFRVRDRVRKNALFQLIHLCSNRTIEFDVTLAVQVYPKYDFVRLSQELYAVTRDSDIVVGMTSKVFVEGIPPCVFTLMNISGFVDFQNARPLEFRMDPIVDIRDHLEPVSLAVAPNFSIAQRALDGVFGRAIADSGLDAFKVHTSALDLDIGSVVYNHGRALYAHPLYDRLLPLLATPMARIRNYTSRESALAFFKRNFAVPELGGLVDVEKAGWRLFENFVRVYLGRDAGEIVYPDITESSLDVYEWLKRQPAGADRLIDPDASFFRTALNQYVFSIKRVPKPVLTMTGASTYASLQTIVYHPKDLTAIFSVLLREVKNRLLGALMKKFVIYTDMTTADLEVAVNRAFPRSDEPMRTLEVDISKYDKSQGAVALEFECLIFAYFGMPHEMVHLWRNAHEYSRVSDLGTGLRAWVEYQRKSGDASTFIGNTMYLMSAIADTVDVSTLQAGLFAGDDSLLVADAEIFCDVEQLANCHNLEAKLYEYPTPYFCSRMLLRVGGAWRVAPDPLKLLVKLGRTDVVNEDHREEYRISLRDTTLAFGDYAVCEAASAAARERYPIDVSIASSLALVVVTVSSPDAFSELFEAVEGSNIDRNQYQHHSLQV